MQIILVFMVVASFLSISALTNSFAAVSNDDIRREMSKFLVCQPLQLVELQKQRPTIAMEDLCLATIYTKTGVRPLWVTPDGPTDKAELVLQFLSNANHHGLPTKLYKVPQMRELWQRGNAADLARLDTLITYNLVKYIHDISYGQLDPHESNPELFAEAGDIDFNPVATIELALAHENLGLFLQQLPPQHHHYTRLKTALWQYSQYAIGGGWPSIDDGLSIYPGDKDPRVVQVRQRLAITGDAPANVDVTDPEYYDPELEGAVLSFQRRHGLETDGVVGPNTRAAMNITAADKVETIRLNLARWRWHNHDLGKRYILVNIASYRLKAYSEYGRKLKLDFPVIVGKEQHQTPVFSDLIQYIDINPFWNITPGIARNEELPALRENPYHLVERNIRLFSSWQEDAVELDSTTLDWQQVSRSQISGYKLRQDPGPWNALGKIKFVFPNRYSVYMHDTPKHELFNHTTRSFSHGCIRLSDPFALAVFVMEDQDGDWGEQELAVAYTKDSRKVIHLSNPLPVHITYQTTWVDNAGQIHFNRDIYSRDAELRNALFR